MWKVEGIVSKGDYNYVIVKDHPYATKHGYVLEHRVVMENHLCRLLNSDEVVHHKNENKKDNRVTNLQVMSKEEHARLHGKSKGRTYVDFVCPMCDSIFTRRKSDSLDKYKGVAKLFFCSKSCGSKYQFCKTREVDVTISENILQVYKDYSEVTV